MKVSQVQTMLVALEGMCALDSNSDTQEGLRKLSTLFKNYENQDIKSVVRLIAAARREAGLRK